MLKLIRTSSLAFAPIIIFIVAWQLWVNANPERAFFFSSPLQLIEVIVEDLASGLLLQNFSITAFEALTGFLLGNFVGILLGLLLWFSDATAKISRPYLIALGAIPVFGIAPMTVIWFGTGIAAKVALAFLATVFIAASQTFKGVENIHPEYLNRMKLLKATRWQMFRFLLIPSAMVWILASLQITISAAMLGAFIGEFISSSQGLGYMIIRASSLYDTARVLEGILAIVVFSLLLDKTMVCITHYFNVSKD